MEQEPQEPQGEDGPPKLPTDSVVDKREFERLEVELSEAAEAEAKEDTDESAKSEKVKALSIAEHLAFENRVRDGMWRPFPGVADFEALIGNPVHGFQEEKRLAADYRKRKKLDPDEPLPIEIEVLFQAQSRFGKTVRGFRGKAADDYPFGWGNFYRLWKESIPFRAFVNVEALEVRHNLEEEDAKLGKASPSA